MEKGLRSKRTESPFFFHCILYPTTNPATRDTAPTAQQ